MKPAPVSITSPIEPRRLAVLPGRGVATIGTGAGGARFELVRRTLPTRTALPLPPSSCRARQGASPLLVVCGVASSCILNGAQPRAARLRGSQIARRSVAPEDQRASNPRRSRILRRKTSASRRRHPSSTSPFHFTLPIAHRACSLGRDDARVPPPPRPLEPCRCYRGTRSSDARLVPMPWDGARRPVRAHFWPVDTTSSRSRTRDDVAEIVPDEGRSRDRRDR